MELNSEIKSVRINNAMLRARYESEIAFNMRKIMRIIADEFEVSYAQKRVVPDIKKYQNDIASQLKLIYIKIANNFKSNFRQPRKALSSDEISRRIDAQLTHHISQHSKKQSEFIIMTLEDMLEADVNEIIIEGATQGISMTRAEIAREAARKFKREGSNHSDTIGTTEYTHMRGYTPILEGQVLKETGTASVKKIWHSTLDMVTRPAHIFADGQITEVEDPFIVGAQKMMFPGDDSLGADAGNIINCRCEPEIIEARA